MKADEFCTPRPKPEPRKPKARKRLAFMSAKRRAEIPLRQQVREAALERAGYDCEASELVPEITCGGPLDVDEKAARGVRPGSHLDLSLVQVLCRNHHDYRHAYPEEAHRRGLRLHHWEVS